MLTSARCYYELFLGGVRGGKCPPSTPTDFAPVEETDFNGKYEKEILHRESRFIAYLNYHLPNLEMNVMGLLSLREDIFKQSEKVLNDMQLKISVITNS